MSDAVRTLVIETATAACSVALVAGDTVVARIHEVVGRGHAERLLPMIAELPDGGRAGGIAVDCGPGSFTGIRVGIAAARGLALGWNVPVRGYASTTLIAAAAQAGKAAATLAVALEAGHGEVFMQTFAADLTTLVPLASLKPADAAALLGDLPVHGSGIARLRAVAPAVAGHEALPDAADWRRLPPALRDLAPKPVYGRAPDAKLPGAAG